MSVVVVLELAGGIYVYLQSDEVTLYTYWYTVVSPSPRLP